MKQTKTRRGEEDDSDTYTNEKQTNRQKKERETNKQIDRGY